MRPHHPCRLRPGIWGLLLLLILPCLPLPAGAGEALKDPYEIYHRHYEAVGGLRRLKALKSVYSEGMVIYDGLKGRFKQWEASPLRYRLEEDYGVIRQVMGDDGQKAWTRDPNGNVLIHKDDETLKRRKIQFLLESYTHLDPFSKVFTLKFDGMKTIDGRPCYIVKMTNSINDDVYWDFIDRDRYRLVRSIVKQPDIEIHTRYSDFRKVDGFLFNFYESSRILPRDKLEILRVDHYKIDAPIDPALFALPAKGADDFHFIDGKASADIPFELLENHIFLPVRIDGSDYRWLLDSGASMSVIDADYAEHLGMTAQGRIKGFGFAQTFDLTFVRLKPYRVGDVRFDSQTVYGYKGLAEAFKERPIVGILGYDFLSRFVTRIDYSRSRLTLYNPHQFHYAGNGKSLDAPLQNKTFTVTATVDGRYEGKWSLDLGSFNTSFTYPFAKKEGLLGRRGVERLSGGMSGEYRERTVQFDSFEIGGFRILTPLISMPLEKDSGAGDSAEIIGHLGNSLLRQFVVYLDYGAQKIILEPGLDFGAAPARDKSGLLLGVADDGRPKVVFVAPETPGQKAGFQAGDKIMRVDQLDTAHMNGPALLRDMLRGKAGTAYRFRVDRKGEHIDLGMELEDLFP